MGMTVIFIMGDHFQEAVIMRIPYADGLITAGGGKNGLSGV
jgi:hypothetical protein